MKKNKKENTVKNNLPSDLNDMWFGSDEDITIQDRYNIQRTLDGLHVEGEEREKMLKALIELYGYHMEGSKTIQDYYDDYMRENTKQELEEIVKKAEAAKQANAEKQTKEDEEELTM